MDLDAAFAGLPGLTPRRAQQRMAGAVQHANGERVFVIARGEVGRDVEGEGLVPADLADVAALLLRTGYAMPVADAEAITVTYSDALALMRDIRGMGETNALSARRRTPLRRATLARTIALYAERFGLADGRIPATFEILFLTGRQP